MPRRRGDNDMGLVLLLNYLTKFSGVKVYFS
jgi:hypothetical protein